MGYNAFPLYHPAFQREKLVTDPQFKLVVGAFRDKAAAETAFDQVKEAAKDESLGIDAVALVRHKEDGTLDIHEMGDRTGKQGALVGGGVGALVGLLGGPVGVLIGAAVGAWYGGIAAATDDGGLPDSDLIDIGALLEPGTLAVVALAAAPGAEWLERQITSEGGALLGVSPDEGEQK